MLSTAMMQFLQSYQMASTAGSGAALTNCLVIHQCHRVAINSLNAILKRLKSGLKPGTRIIKQS